MNADPLCGLPRAAALCDLATTIFYARAQIYNLDVPHWDALTFEEKHVYVTEAEAVIARVSPAAVTRPLAGSTSQAGSTVHIFDQAAQMARAEGARLLAFRGLDTSDGRD